MKFKIATFYKYAQVESPDSLRDEIKTFCAENRISGRILIGKEGINGAISGEVAPIEKFKSWIKGKNTFSSLTFREQNNQSFAHQRLVVKVRDEIVNFGHRVDLKNSGEQISPKKLKGILDKKSNVILLDARNVYETKVGAFKGAIKLPLKSFREFPKAIKSIENLKRKKIIMYCTGGVRCEKASAFLKESGFKKVYQLEGGIINYTNQFPDTHFEGSCFVFDSRLVSSVSSKITSKCDVCGSACDTIINCNNDGCDRLFVSCRSCQKSMNRNCSAECVASSKQKPGVKV